MPYFTFDRFVTWFISDKQQFTIFGVNQLLQLSWAILIFLSCLILPAGPAFEPESSNQGTINSNFDSKFDFFLPYIFQELVQLERRKLREPEEEKRRLLVVNIQDQSVTKPATKKSTLYISLLQSRFRYSII